MHHRHGAMARPDEDMVVMQAESKSTESFHLILTFTLCFVSTYSCSKPRFRAGLTPGRLKRILGQPEHRAMGMPSTVSVMFLQLIIWNKCTSLTRPLQCL